MPIRVQIFEFLVFPAMQWTKLCALLCGISFVDVGYDPDLDEDED